LPGDLADDRGVDAAHVNLELGHVFNVVYEVAYALVHKQVDLQKVCRYQDRDDVLLIEGWQFRFRFFILAALLYLKGPGSLFGWLLVVRL
jgi:hypothetical protein